MDSISIPDPIGLSCCQATQQVSDRVHDIYINISCKYLTEDSVYLQYNVTLYIQTEYVSENARNALLGVGNTNIFLGRMPPDSLLLHTTPHQTFCHQQASVFSPHSVQYGPFLWILSPPPVEINLHALFRCPIELGKLWNSA